MASEFGLSKLKELAEKFANDWLADYVKEIQSPNYKATRKEINDALWGTISLSPAEVLVLDSPLLQRLRYIRQLGVVHWVYPGAIHTRFEHTLGVLFQVQNLISALNSQAQNGAVASSSSNIISKDQANILRLCALLHDVGHAAFSHVSEMAIESVPETNLLASEFGRLKNREAKKFSEIFAYYVIKSEGMRSLLNVLLQKYHHISIDLDQDRNLNAVIDMLAEAIIGGKIDDRLPLLHELISGPFDADKLDYFTRDSKLAGTPSVLDISRLVQKISIRSLDSNELPHEIASNVARLEEKHYLFGIKWSGVAVLDELHLARVLLYAKIYRHPKVIAIEQMLKSVILSLAQISPIEHIVSFLYENPDDALLAMSEEGLAAAIRTELPEQDEIKIERLRCAKQTLKAIRNRRLWVRAFQVQQRYPGDPLEGNRDQKDGLIAFREDMEHPQKGKELLANLIAEVTNVLSYLDAELAKKYKKIVLESSVMIHAIGNVPGGTQIERAYLMPAAGKPIPYREYTVNRSAWASAYLSDQPSGYIFCPSELADVVYVAVEKILRTQFEVRLPPSAMEVSKRDSLRIKEMKGRLNTAGYYQGTPFDLRPSLARLQRADVPQIVEQFSRIRAAYLEPQCGDQEIDTDHLERINLWLRQFDDDQHVECAMKLLAKFRMIDRQDTINALKKFIGENEQFRGAFVVPLGTVKDSGAIQSYFSADLNGVIIEKCTTLEEAAASDPSRPVIFIDDFTGSGGQAVDILSAGFDLPDSRRMLGEERQVYSSAIQEYLRGVAVGFVFVAAWDIGISAIEEIIRQLRIKGSVFRLIGESEIPFAFECLLEDFDPEIVESFKNRCIEIGTALLDGHEKTNERYLGYGNRAMLLSTPFNVPTQTLIAIWGSGSVNDVSWSPLMARRKKT